MIVTGPIALKKINAQITKRIIELQNNGYIYDFEGCSESAVVCIQNGYEFPESETSIKLIDLRHNEISKEFTYIHTIDTFCGYKGIILCNRILCNCYID